jgi:hypothetical protein
MKKGQSCKIIGGKVGGTVTHRNNRLFLQIQMKFTPVCHDFSCYINQIKKQGDILRKNELKTLYMDSLFSWNTKRILSFLRPVSQLQGFAGEPFSELPRKSFPTFSSGSLRQTSPAYIFFIRSRRLLKDLTFLNPALSSFSLAACISTVSNKPLVSVMMCLLRPFIFFPPSKPRLLPPARVGCLLILHRVTGAFFAVPGICHAIFHGYTRMYRLSSTGKNNNTPVAIGENCPANRSGDGSGRHDI